MGCTVVEAASQSLMLVERTVLVLGYKLPNGRGLGWEGCMRRIFSMLLHPVLWSGVRIPTLESVVDN